MSDLEFAMAMTATFYGLAMIVIFMISRSFSKRIEEHRIEYERQHRELNEQIHEIMATEARYWRRIDAQDQLDNPTHNWKKDGF